MKKIKELFASVWILTWYPVLLLCMFAFYGCLVALYRSRKRANIELYRISKKLVGLETYTLQVGSRNNGN